MGTKNPQQLARAKYTGYLRKQGRARLVDVAPVRARLRELHYFYGMSSALLAEKCSVSQGTISEIIQGYRRNDPGRKYEIKEIYRENAESIMAIEPEMITKRGGSRVNAIGTVRRIQALVAIGFPIAWISRQAGFGGRTFYQIPKGERAFVFFSTAYKVKELYDRLEIENPRHHGISKHSMQRTQTYARRNGYLPPGVWDWETIDDPEAQPDFTGECGTPSGAGIHVRRGILPVCEPCATALREHETALRYARAARKAAEGV